MAKGSFKAKPQKARKEEDGSAAVVKHKRRTGTRTLQVRRIKKEQVENSQRKPAVPRAVMGRFIRHVARDVDPTHPVHWSKDAMRAVHSAAEHYLVDAFKSAAVVSGANKRILTMERDWTVVLQLRTSDDLGTHDHPEIVSARVF